MVPVSLNNASLQTRPEPAPLAQRGPPSKHPMGVPADRHYTWLTWQPQAGHHINKDVLVLLTFFRFFCVFFYSFHFPFLQANFRSFSFIFLLCLSRFDILFFFSLGAFCPRTCSLWNQILQPECILLSIKMH